MGADTYVSVISAVRATGDLWAVRVRLADGRVVAMVMSYDDCHLSQVVVAAGVVGALAAAGRL